ncbi:MAG: hypothetical protein QGI83_08670 [Candidatus Latescibacteria bacterium]|jgi:hypothetical protein|nr:hypothetical protein [Candidatus Latescibacterota bacterium]
MASNVQRADGRVQIEGVPEKQVGWGWDAILRGLQIILEYRGNSVSLDELMAYGGDAFNLCHGSHWQDVAYLMVPTNPVANIAAAYGYEYGCVHNGFGAQKMDKLDLPDREKETAAILERIWSEIDAERPVLVGGCTDQGCGVWSVVVDYDRDKWAMGHVGLGNGPRWIRVRGFEGHPDYGEDIVGMWNGRFRGTVRENFVGGWQVNPAYLLGKKTDAPSREERVAAALERAVEMFEAPKYSIGWWGGVDYHFGREAYEKWAEDLSALDYPADLERELPGDAYDWYRMGNMDTQVDQVVRVRSAAATFCDSAAEVFPDAAGDLVSAAEAYRQEVAIAREVFEAFIPAYDGNDAPRVAWLSTETEREAGAQAIRRMLEHEREAIGHIRSALRVMAESQP